MDNLKYCSYDKYCIWYDIENHSFKVLYGSFEIIRDAVIKGIYRDGTITAPADFDECKTDYKRSDKANETTFEVIYKNTDDDAITLSFCVKDGKISIFSHDAEFEIEGIVSVPADDIKDVFPACLDRCAKDLRSAIGNGATRADNALYNRRTDMAVVIGKSGKTQIIHAEGRYDFSIHITSDEADIYVKENVLAQKYNIVFNPINPNTTFKTPPMGWMTWYAVKFDACEAKVLENAKWQAENLKDFGANAIWVDWEWYHEKLFSEREDGVHSLNPDPEKYPNGMGYVAERIKELGLVPCLWIGYTNEPCKNEFMEKYPEMILSDEVSWCGRYFYDFSNPHYLEEFLPVALNNVHKWGYDAVKYDVLPSAVYQHEKNHANMYDPTLTTKEAFRNMVKKTRDILGKDMYVLSCSGQASAEILWASDMFDAARIGQDIFSWDDYLINCIDKVIRYYPLHNIQMYNDPDNVVLREEFNTFEQAKSRASLVSLLGMPMTFGDEFSALDGERINLLKRTLPVLDIHPSDLCNSEYDKEQLLINLNVEKNYEAYLVSGMFNLLDEDVLHTFSLSDDLHLQEGEYLVYDFYRDEFLGKISGSLTLNFKPYECRILSIRPISGVPQVVSTSRHITQGAAEILDMKFEGNTLTLLASLIQNDAYIVKVYVPEGYELKDYTGFEKAEIKDNILSLTIIPDKTAEYEFAVRFTENEIK